MREETVKIYRNLLRFYNDIIKISLILFLLGLIIIILFESMRFNFAIYLFWYLICFSISFFKVFLKREIKDDLARGDK